MSDNQFSTTEEQASYGIGMQMGQQISSAFPGVSTAAAMAGLEDAIFGKPQQVSADDINAACGQLVGQVADKTRRQEKYKRIAAGGIGRHHLVHHYC